MPLRSTTATTLLLCLIGLCLTGRSAHADEAMDEIHRGAYLVSLLGCGTCHTEGALLGAPSGPALAGSRIGIGYGENDRGDVEGVAYPPNLTPDASTGIGAWSKRDLRRAISSGTGHQGQWLVGVMPWSAYGALRDSDLDAIVSYLKSLPPITRSIPERIDPPKRPTEPFIRIGYLVFMPSPIPEAAIEDNTR